MNQTNEPLLLMIVFALALLGLVAFIVWSNALIDRYFGGEPDSDEPIEKEYRR
jgi:hypothetical protein